MILCLAANPSVDKLFEVPSVRHGQIHRPAAFLAVPGGKGLNVARAAARLGGEVVATGLLGGHVGRWVQEQLIAEGVQAHFAWTQAETRASLSVADRETGGLTEFYEDSGPVGDEDWRALETLVGTLLDGARWLAVSGTMPTGAPADGYARIIATARRRGVPTALDTRESALAASLPACPELVKINHTEAGQLLGRDLADGAEVRAGALELRDRLGGEGHAVAVTMGTRGAVLVDPEGAVWHGRSSARGPYPVGSGDVFLGALLTALDREADWGQAFRIAIGASAANAEVPGAACFDPERARVLAGEAEVHPPRSRPAPRAE